MGCSNHKREFYTEAEYDEEVELRKFEEELGAFRKNLNTVLPRICIEKDIISVTNVEDFILKDFSENFLKLIQQGYFFKFVEGKRYYDARKVNLLLFLLTNDTLINNGKISYHDKASFIYTLVKTREDQNLSDPIEENEENFRSIIEDLVDIACVGIVDSYIKLKNVQREGYIGRLKTIKTEVVEYLIKTLFFNKKDNSAGLTFDDLNAKFNKDKFMFTAGYIREFAWEILIKGKAQDLDKLKAEEDKKEEEAAKVKK